MKKIYSLFFRITYWLENKSPWFAKFQKQRRFKKWDDAPYHRGINSHNNPYIYNFLLSDNLSLSDFELNALLTLFYYERFSVVTEKEFNNWHSGINSNFMNESVKKLGIEMTELFRSNRRKYLSTRKSFEMFIDMVSKTKNNRDENKRKKIRNIKRLYCELRILLNKHILDSEQE